MFLKQKMMFNLDVPFYLNMGFMYPNYYSFLSKSRSDDPEDAAFSKV